MSRAAMAAMLGTILACGLAAGAPWRAREAAAAPASPSQRVAPAVPSAPPGGAGAVPSAPGAASAAPSAPAQAGRELVVRRLSLTRSLAGREPVPIRGPLRVGEDPILAFVELFNPDRTERKIVVSFVRDRARPVASIELVVPAGHARWRTWAESRRVRAPGGWEAVVSTADGKELARVGFELAGTE